MAIKNNQIEDAPRKLTKSTKPTTGSGKGAFYTEEVSGVTEGFYVDSVGNATQITNGGAMKIPTAAVGEVNTASTVTPPSGVVSYPLTLPKDGVNLPFKGLKAGTNVTLSPTATHIEVNAVFPPSVGEANTASNVGAGGVGIFKQKTGLDLEFRKIRAGSNVTVNILPSDEIEISAAGGGVGTGDMQKSVYDSNDNGVVDNSEKLNNQNASYYLDRTNHTGTMSAASVTGLASVATVGTFDSLSDVNTSGVTDGQTIIYQSSTSSWIPGTASGGGSGDMLKSVYDTTNNGVVDNSEKLNNQAASFYLSRANHTGTQSVSSITGLASVATVGTLDSLSNVLASGKTSGQVLQWSGTAWIPATVSGTGDMQKSVYDTTNNGVVDNSEKLNNQAASFYLDRTNHTGTQSAASITGLASVATSGTLDSLTDVSTSGASEGKVLTYTSGAWAPATPSGGGGGGLVRYQAGMTAGDECWVLATGTGVTYSRTGNEGTLLVPSGVQVVSLKLRVNRASTISGAFVVDFGNVGGTGANTNQADCYFPTCQAFREDTSTNRVAAALGVGYGDSGSFSKIKITGFPLSTPDYNYIVRLVW
jgi:hypothetical protein